MSEYEDSVCLAGIGVKTGSYAHTELLLDAEFDLFWSRGGLVNVQAQMIELYQNLESALGQHLGAKIRFARYALVEMQMKWAGVANFPTVTEEFFMRHSDLPVDSIFINRWSPRAFTSEKIPKTVLMTGFEAARWAPSSANGQPSRFVYAENGDTHWQEFCDFLVEGNRVWADKAAALVVVISKKDAEWNGKIIPSPTHSFDTGAAWMSFALQLEKLGWATHGMGGIEKDKIRQTLKLPENFDVECMIAVGKIGDPVTLPPPLQGREMPNDRRPMEKMVEHGTFEA